MYVNREDFGWGCTTEVLEVSRQDLLRQMREIEPGDHLVALYHDRQEIVDYVSAYIQAALAQKAKCVYIAGDMDKTQVEGIRSRLDDRGALTIIDHTEIYSQNGVFSPDRLIAAFQAAAEEALKEGYKSLAITGELSWLVNYDDAEDLIIEYEWKLNEYVFGHYPVSALCRYNLDKFSDSMIRSVIQLHPIILWQNRIHENPYYIPPEGFMKNSVAKYQVKAWLENTSRFTDKQSRFETIFAKQEEEIRQLHEDMTNGIIAAFLKLLEIHDPYTKDHCSNVALLARRLADKLNMPEAFKTRIYYSGLIHDIGKTLIPTEILNKPASLTTAEYEQIKLHSVYGAQALSQVNPLEEITLAVRHHHERFDGRDYPDGLAGGDIPLMARIIALCDSYDAMTNDRPYRKALSHEEAMSEIRRSAGGQFDPELVEPFLACLAA